MIKISENVLSDDLSPYLRQHKDNPVNWQTWSKETLKFSKKNNVMADIVINHSSARGLWFRNFLKNKKPGKDYFLTVKPKFDVSKVIRPRDHKLLKRINIFKKKRNI